MGSARARDKVSVAVGGGAVPPRKAGWGKLAADQSRGATLQRIQSWGSGSPLSFPRMLCRRNAGSDYMLYSKSWWAHSKTTTFVSALGRDSGRDEPRILQR